MKLPELPENLKRWDQWSAFHWGFNGSVTATSTYAHPPIIIFDTGEVIFEHHNPRPDSRHSGRAMNLEICLSGELARLGICLETAEGEAVPARWLYDYKQAALLIDRDTGRCVGLSNNIESDALPRRFMREIKQGDTTKWYPKVAAYFPGPGLPPIGGPIVLSKPRTKTLTKEQREHIDGINAALRAEVTLTETKPPMPEYPRYNPNQPKEEWQSEWTRYSTWATARGLNPQRILECQTHKDLDPIETAILYYKGVTRVKQTVPYLKVRQS